MAEPTRLHIDQVAERALLNALAVLPEKIFRKVVRRATNKAMTPVLKAARRLVSRRSGTLRKSLGKLTRVYPRRKTITTLVGPRSGYISPTSGSRAGEYGNILEHGAGPHEIILGKPLFLAGIGLIWGEKVMHPGTSPRPFLRPALSSNKAKAIGIFTKSVREGIEKETKALARKG